MCLGQSCAGSSQLEQSLDQGRGAAGLRWTASLEEKAEEGTGLVFRLPAFVGDMFVYGNSSGLTGYFIHKRSVSNYGIDTLH